MTRTGRYVFTPAGHAAWRRRGIISRIRKWALDLLEVKPDVYMVTGFNQPVYPNKK